MNMNKKIIASAAAFLAAALYAINIPFSKLLTEYVSPTMMAGLLYLGAGVGMLLYTSVSGLFGKKVVKEPLTKKELPYTIAMVVLDIFAPILLMNGLVITSSANATLLNNFEIVATSIIALVIFKEVVSKRLWIAIALVTLSSVILTFEGAGSFNFNIGSLLVLGATICWGFENNCTNKISNKSSEEIVTIKGIFSGLGSLIAAFIIGEQLPGLLYIACVLILGFVSYGLSINFYISAQKHIGAAKTSAYYAVAPFLGVVFSLILLGERPGIQFYVALVVMILGTIMIVRDTLSSSDDL
ncbi:MAG: DMT family transporter [Lachnospiraceae bacterium]|nr:DMT family transporter [Lachnospiraceae bacterium]